MLSPKEKAEEIITHHKEHLFVETRFNTCCHAIVTIKMMHDELKRLGVNQPELDQYYEDMLQYIFNNRHCNAGK